MADEGTVSVEMRPEEAISLAVVHDLFTNHPEVVTAILRQHEVQPSTDPEENILLLSKLSAERGRFFNEDFAKGAKVAGYYGTEFVPDIVCKYVARNKDIKKFQAGYFSLKDVFGKIKDQVKNVFGKKDQPNLSPGDIATAPAADDIASKVDKAAKDPAAKDDKKIMGLKPWIFWTGLGTVIVLIVVIIILVIRAGKKKEGEKK